MGFEKGHKLAKGGKRAGAGRKPSLRVVMQRALEQIDQKFPGLIDKLIELAMDGNTEALKYLLDRRLGKPSFQGQVDIKGGEQIGVETFKALIEGMVERKKQIESMSDAEIKAEAEETWLNDPARLKYLKEGEE